MTNRRAKYDLAMVPPSKLSETDASATSGTTEDQPWYAPGLNFQCTQCGDCCTGPPGYVWFSPEEGAAMAEFLGIDENTFYFHYAVKKSGRWTLDEVKRKGKYDCVFLKTDPKTGKSGCSIYKVRPTQCRTWPFWDSNLSSPRAWARAAKSCPGMKEPGSTAGTFVPVEQIRIELAENPEGL